MEQNNNKNSDKIERKVWEIPTIEILNINETKGGGAGTGETTVSQPISVT